MTLRSKLDDRISILEKIENRLSNYKKFEDSVVDYLEEDYFSFAFQSFYNKIGYKELKNYLQLIILNFLYILTISYVL